LSPERIVNLVESHDKDIKAIQQDLFRLCWHMRGGLTYEEALNLSFSERQNIGILIKENMETTKKTGLPYF